MSNQVAILVLPLHALWPGLNDVPLWDSVVWWANIVRIKRDGVRHCARHILGTQKSGTSYYGSCCHPLEQCFTNCKLWLGSWEINLVSCNQHFKKCYNRIKNSCLHCLYKGRIAMLSVYMLSAGLQYKMYFLQRVDVKMIKSPVLSNPTQLCDTADTTSAW